MAWLGLAVSPVPRLFLGCDRGACCMNGGCISSLLCLLACSCMLTSWLAGSLARRCPFCLLIASEPSRDNSISSVKRLITNHGSKTNHDPDFLTKQNDRMCLFRDISLNARFLPCVPKRNRTLPCNSGL